MPASTSRSSRSTRAGVNVTAPRLNAGAKGITANRGRVSGAIRHRRPATNQRYVGHRA